MQLSMANAAKEEVQKTEAQYWVKTWPKEACVLQHRQSILKS